jgi:ABC-type antimicrobial peptide transport system permease subunit
VPLDDVRPVEAIAAELTATPRYSAALVALLGGVALLLAAVGVYGLGSFAVAQRTREIGIRIALGATRATVIRLALLRGLVPALIGCALGALVAWLTVGQLRGLLYDVEASNPTVLAAAMGILIAAAGVAAYLPARRAARTDPLVALRTE